MAPDVIVPGSALRVLAEAVASIFVRRTLNYELNWIPTVDFRGQVLIRSGSKAAIKVRVEPINIKSAKLLDHDGAKRVVHGGEVLVHVEQDKRVSGIPIYWVKWNEGFAKRYQSQVRVMYPPQVF